MIPTWIATSAPLVLTSKSTLSNKMEKLSNSRFGPQQAKSVSERSPAFTTEELICDSGVGKSCLLLRFAVSYCISLSFSLLGHYYMFT
ncbi:unnamed protein product [Brassica oleracea var. botrytis]